MTTASTVNALSTVILVSSLLAAPSIASALGTDDRPNAWLQRQKVTPTDADAPGVGGNDAHWGVYFGSEVVVDGDTMAVGTQYSRHSDAGYEGVDGFDWAYVFHRSSDGTWTQSAKLVPDDPEPGDSFAYSLALDEESGIVVAGNPAASKVHVFEREGPGTWASTWNASEETRDFGQTVAVSGTTILVGTWTGPLYVYEKGDRGWETAGTLDANGVVDAEDAIMVARSDPEPEIFNVYHREGPSWEQTATLTPPSRPARTPVAGAVDLSPDEDTVVFGAATEDRRMGLDGAYEPLHVSAAGLAWVYERVDGRWVLSGVLENPDPEYAGKFGESVGVWNDSVVVGAPGDMHNGAEAAGAIYVYERSEVGWTLTNRIRNSDGTTYGDGDWFGESVSITSSTVVAGAPADDNRRDGTPPPLDDQGDLPPCLYPKVVWGCDRGENAGSVYVFDTTETTAVDDRGERRE